jgi:MFS transporter, FSR family, fosmidomycin resistance protein
MDYSEKISLSFLGVTHALVDATTVSVVLLSQKIFPLSFFGVISLVLLYNIIAFGLQFVFGAISDKWKDPKQISAMGLFLTGISIFLINASPVAAVLFSGMGNALFHVGGGSISLSYRPGKATAPGIFVAPGALGLTLGILFGKNNFLPKWTFLTLLLLSIVIFFIIRFPEVSYKRAALQIKINYLWIGIILLLLSVAVRSLAGVAFVFPWKTNFNLLIILTLAIMAGKGLGGFLADRFGWLRTVLLALLLSIPLLTLGAKIPIFAIPGALLFNMTMPVTLVAVVAAFPGRPGFAFGLTCLALFLGAFSALWPEIVSALGSYSLIMLLVLSSTIIIYSSLTLFYRHKIISNNN